MPLLMLYIETSSYMHAQCRSTSETTEHYTCMHTRSSFLPTTTYVWLTLYYRFFHSYATYCEWGAVVRFGDLDLRTEGRKIESRSEPEFQVGQVRVMHVE